MNNLDHVRMAGTIVDLLESLGFRRDDIHEIAELVKRQVDIKQQYEVPVTAPGPCTN